MSKSKLAEPFGFVSLSEADADIASNLRFIKEAETESSRGAVLTIVSFIEEQLTKTLLAFFPDEARGGSA